MPWIIFSGISIIASSVSALFQKLAMKHEDSDPIVSAIHFQLLLTIFGFLFAFLTGFKFPPVSLLPYFLMSGALYACGTVAFFRSIKLIEASEMTVLTGSGVLFTILISFIFIHERLTFLQLIGAALILSAVILINYNRKKFHINAGAGLAILGSVLYGTAVVIDTYIVKYYDAISFVALASFTPGLFIALWFIKKIPKTITSIKYINRNLLIYSFLYTIAGIAFYLALQNGALVSQAGTISRASIILTVILAAFFLGERKHVWKKIVAAILTTIGVLLVSR